MGMCLNYLQNEHEMHTWMPFLIYMLVIIQCHFTHISQVTIALEGPICTYHSAQTHNKDSFTTAYIGHAIMTQDYAGDGTC
jgi:hypothetical protein